MTIISPIELAKKLELGLSLTRILISLNKLRRTNEQTWIESSLAYWSNDLGIMGCCFLLFRKLGKIMWREARWLWYLVMKKKKEAIHIGSLPLVIYVINQQKYYKCVFTFWSLINMTCKK